MPIQAPLQQSIQSVKPTGPAGGAGPGAMGPLIASAQSSLNLPSGGGGSAPRPPDFSGLLNMLEARKSRQHSREMAKEARDYDTEVRATQRQELLADRKVARRFKVLASETEHGLNVKIAAMPRMAADLEAVGATLRSPTIPLPAHLEGLPSEAVAQHAINSAAALVEYNSDPGKMARDAYSDMNKRFSREFPDAASEKVGRPERQLPDQSGLNPADTFEVQMRTDSMLPPLLANLAQMTAKLESARGKGKAFRNMTKQATSINAQLTQRRAKIEKLITSSTDATFEPQRGPEGRVTGKKFNPKGLIDSARRNVLSLLSDDLAKAPGTQIKRYGLEPRGPTPDITAKAPTPAASQQMAYDLLNSVSTRFRPVDETLALGRSHNWDPDVMKRFSVPVRMQAEIKGEDVPTENYEYPDYVAAGIGSIVDQVMVGVGETLSEVRGGKQLGTQKLEGVEYDRTVGTLVGMIAELEKVRAGVAELGGKHYATANALMEQYTIATQLAMEDMGEFPDAKLSDGIKDQLAEVLRRDSLWVDYHIRHPEFDTVSEALEFGLQQLQQGRAPIQPTPQELVGPPAPELPPVQPESPVDLEKLLMEHGIGGPE